MNNAWWSPAAPWVHRLPDADYGGVMSEAPLGAVSFVLDGSVMRDHDGLFHEFASKMSFPGYFGENWPALQDCLDDMTWVPAATHYLIVIENWAAVLEESKPDRVVLERILRDVGENWGRLGHGPGSGFDIVAFNTILII